MPGTNIASMYESLNFRVSLDDRVALEHREQRVLVLSFILQCE